MGPESNNAAIEEDLDLDDSEHTRPRKKSTKASRMKAEEKAMKAAADATRAARKAMEAAGDEGDEEIDPIAEARESIPLFGTPDDQSAVVILEKRCCNHKEHMFTPGGEKAWTGVCTSEMPPEQCTIEAIRELYGGGCYFIDLKVGTKYGGRRKKSISGPALPNEVLAERFNLGIEDQEEDEPGPRMFGPYGMPMSPMMMGPMGPVPNPYMQPASQPNLDRFLERQQEREDDAREREEKRREREEERRRDEIKILEAKWEREDRLRRDLKAEEDKRREEQRREDERRWREELKAERERRDEMLKLERDRMQHEREMSEKSMERQMASQEKLFTLMTQQNKPSEHLQTMSSLFTGIFDIVRAAVSKDSEEPSVTGQLVNLLPQILPQVMPQPAQAAPQAQQQMTPQQIMVAVQKDNLALIQAQQQLALQPGGQIIRLGHANYRVLTPAEVHLIQQQYAQAGMAPPQFAPQMSVPAQIPQVQIPTPQVHQVAPPPVAAPQAPPPSAPVHQAPVQEESPYIAPNAIDVLKTKRDSGVDPFQASIELFEAGLLNDAACIQIYQSYQNAPDGNTARNNLLSLLARHSVQNALPVLAGMMNTEDGRQWLDCFLNGLMYDDAEEARRIYESAQAPVDAPLFPQTPANAIPLATVAAVPPAGSLPSPPPPSAQIPS